MQWGYFEVGRKLTCIQPSEGKASKGEWQDEVEEKDRARYKERVKNKRKNKRSGHISHCSRCYSRCVRPVVSR